MNIKELYSTAKIIKEEQGECWIFAKVDTIFVPVYRWYTQESNQQWLLECIQTIKKSIVETSKSKKVTVEDLIAIMHSEVQTRFQINNQFSKCVTYNTRGFVNFISLLLPYKTGNCAKIERSLMLLIEKDKLGFSLRGIRRGLFNPVQLMFDIVVDTLDEYNSFVFIKNSKSFPVNDDIFGNYICFIPRVQRVVKSVGFRLIKPKPQKTLVLSPNSLK